MEDNQQVSSINNGVIFITRTALKKGKWYALYLCPSCNQEVEIRMDTVTEHYKKYDYPKLCSKCANKLAAKKRVKHGALDTRLYSIWKNMLSRCSPTSVHERYRNMYVFEEWKHGFIPFQQWALNNGYNESIKDLSIDRIDPKKGYYPENCRFISIAENTRRASIRQANNSNTKIPESELPHIDKLYKSGMSQQKIANIYGVARTTIAWIVNRKTSTTIPTGSTSEAIADGSGEHPEKDEDIV